MYASLPYMSIITQLIISIAQNGAVVLVIGAPFSEYIPINLEEMSLTF